MLNNKSNITKLIKEYVKNQENKERIKLLVESFVIGELKEEIFFILFFTLIEIEKFEIKRIHISEKVTLIIESDFYFVNFKGELEEKNICIYIVLNDEDKDLICNYINVEGNNNPINQIKNINYNFILNKIKKC